VKPTRRGREKNRQRRTSSWRAQPEEWMREATNKYNLERGEDQVVQAVAATCSHLRIARVKWVRNKEE
jgi:hypothetical protein